MDRLAEHALDLFAALGVPVVARRMFGGLGFYAGGLFFAIGDPDEGRLYLKVDAACRPAFEAAGGRPFTYSAPGKEVLSMAYLTPPDAALEDPEEMLPWARLALEAARRAAALKAQKARATAERRAGKGKAGKGGAAKGAAARRGAAKGRPAKGSRPDARKGRRR